MIRLLKWHDITSLAAEPQAVEHTMAQLLKEQHTPTGILIDDLDLYETHHQAYWSDGKVSFWLSTPKHDHRYECDSIVYKRAIDNAIKLGYEVNDAVVIGTMVANRVRRLGELVDASWPEQQEDLPYLSLKPWLTSAPVFSQEGLWQMGLYPIIDETCMLKPLLDVGVQCIQLRMKQQSLPYLHQTIEKSVLIARQYQAKLFINDHWELALHYGAYGVHLGQDDIKNADIQAIHTAGLRLGISTHCYYEVACAHAYQPSYLACGPIYVTFSKAMQFKPQGLSALARWRRSLNYPLVVIGGINEGNIDAVWAEKINGVAVLSAITKAAKPHQAAQRLLGRVFSHNTEV